MSRGCLLLQILQDHHGLPRLNVAQCVFWICFLAMKNAEIWCDNFTEMSTAKDWVGMPPRLPYLHATQKLESGPLPRRPQSFAICPSDWKSSAGRSLLKSIICISLIIPLHRLGQKINVNQTLQMLHSLSKIYAVKNAKKKQCMARWRERERLQHDQKPLLRSTFEARTIDYRRYLCYGYRSIRFCIPHPL